MSPQANKTKRREIFKRAESYVKEYRRRERELIRARRTAKSAGYFFVEPEAKVAFVIRIRGCVSLKQEVISSNTTNFLFVFPYTSQYQPSGTKGEKDLATVETPPNQQWCVCEAESCHA